MAAFNRYGIPDELLTDNGKQFAARFNPGGGETLFDRICRENGIVHHLTKPRSPTTTGKIERFHQTLQNELLNESTQRARQAGGRRDGAALECRLRRPQPGLSRPPGAGLMITAQSRIGEAHSAGFLHPGRRAAPAHNPRRRNPSPTTRSTIRLHRELDKLLIAAMPAAQGVDTDATTGPHAGIGPDVPLLPALVRLDEIPGVGAKTAQVILAEIGLDMTRFPTAAHLLSWARLSPRTVQSGPRHRAAKTGKGKPYLKGVLGEAAAPAATSDNSRPSATK